MYSGHRSLHLGWLACSGSRAGRQIVGMRESHIQLDRGCGHSMRCTPHAHDNGWEKFKRVADARRLTTQKKKNEMEAISLGDHSDTQCVEYGMRNEECGRQDVGGGPIMVTIMVIVRVGAAVEGERGCRRISSGFPQLKFRYACIRLYIKNIHMCCVGEFEGVQVKPQGDRRPNTGMRAIIKSKKQKAKKRWKLRPGPGRDARREIYNTRRRSVIVAYSRYIYMNVSMHEFFYRLGNARSLARTGRLATSNCIN